MTSTRRSSGSAWAILLTAHRLGRRQRIADCLVGRFRRSAERRIDVVR